MPRHRYAFVKFGAADGAHGFDQAANRTCDAHGEKISEEQRHECDADDESQRLRGQLVYARVHARVVKTALRDHGPSKLGNRAVGADHFHRVTTILAGRKKV